MPPKVNAESQIDDAAAKPTDNVTIVLVAVLVIIIIYFMYLVRKGQLCRDAAEKFDPINPFGDLTAVDDPMDYYYKYSNLQNEELMPPPTLVPGANTMIRPGTHFDLIQRTPKDAEKTPLLRVTMLYTPNCRVHPLVAVFNELQRQMQEDQLTKGIEFRTEVVDVANSFNSMHGPFPKIFKQRSGGKRIEYRGQANWGRLNDWVRNESLLF